MAKTLFRGSAVLTGALLLTALTFNASPSVAEHLAAENQQDKTQQTAKTTGTGLPVEVAFAAPSPADPAATATAADAQRPGGGPPATVSFDKNETETVAAPQKFTATAYALRGRTASGAGVRRGLIAADHRLFPLGTRVRLEAGGYSGEYLVADRGGAVRGRVIDIWVPSTGEAMRFGRRPVKLTVLSYGAKRANRPRR
jgi:3D (Asp-Asp-Asp) domain-containing protein